MSDLIAIAYPDEHRAAEVLGTLRRPQNEYRIDLEDALYVTRDANGTIKLRQSLDLVGAGAAGGALWGTAIGLLFLNPLLGALIGAATGALSGSLADYGIKDSFIRQLSQRLQPNSSAIFILARRMTVDKVVPEVARYGGTILQSSLSDEAERRLEHALSRGSVPLIWGDVPPRPATTSVDSAGQ